MSALEKIRLRNDQYQLYGGLKGDRESVEDVPLLLNTLEAVQAVHESAEILSLTHDGIVDEDGEVLRVYCTACTSDDVKELIGDCEWTEDYEPVAYPCPTVRAIESA